MPPFSSSFLRRFDRQLIPFLVAQEGPQDRKLDDIMKSILKQVALLVRCWMLGDRPEDREEIRSVICQKLVCRIQAAVTGRNGTPIENLRAYVRETTRREIHHFIATKHPGWQSTLKKLNAIVAKPGDLDMWDGWYGLKIWNRPRSDDSSIFLHALELNPCQATTEIMFLEGPSEVQVRRLLERIGHPVHRNVFVSILQQLWDSSDAGAVLLAEIDPPDPNSHEKIYLILADFWHAIQQLNRNQRCVVLLNHPYQTVMEQWDRQGIASLEDIAKALQLPMRKFTELSVHLPLTDEQIGQMIKVRADYVARLRKQAREAILKFQRQSEDI